VEKSLFRKLLSLAVVVLIAHAGWKIGPVFFRYLTFKDKITEVARYSGSHSAADLQKEILAIANSEGVPLDPKAINVQKSGQRVRVDATYTEQLEFLPRYYYPSEFTISIETALARSMTPGDIR
jgi:hypothetical protein